MKKELDYRSAFRHGSQRARSWSISRAGATSVNVTPLLRNCRKN